jgi:AbrB family looped-hinge helix DNA binding protein
MSYTISMDKAGRIVIPKEVRERIGADETTKFDLDILLDRIELKPAPPMPSAKSKIIQKGKAWVIVGTGQPRMSVVEAIRQDREERMDFLANPEKR